MTKHKNIILRIWERSGNLATKEYISLVPILISLFFIYTIVFQFMQLSNEIPKYRLSDGIFIVLSALILLLFICLNARFYPWVKVWSSIFFLTRDLFPEEQSHGLKHAIINTWQASKEAYKNTDYDYTTYYQDGEFFTQKENRSKRANWTDTLLMQGFLTPLLRLLYLLIIFGFSFILGWFVIPSIARKAGFEV